MENDKLIHEITAWIIDNHVDLEVVFAEHNPSTSIKIKCIKDIEPVAQTPDSKVIIHSINGQKIEKEFKDSTPYKAVIKAFQAYNNT